MVRYFWVYSDGETIKEINQEEYFEIIQKNVKRNGKIHLVRVHRKDFYTTKRYITLGQLHDILIRCEEGW